MSLPFHYPRKVGFVLAMAILLISGSVAVLNLRELVQNGKEAIRTAETMRELDKTLSLLSTADTSTRSYLLMGKDSYLKPYRIAIGARGIRVHLQTLHTLIAEEPTQQSRLTVLHSLIALQLRDFQKILDAQHRQNLLAARALVISNIQEGTLEKIRSLIESMNEDEDNLMDQRTDARAHSAQKAVSSVVGGIGVAVALLSFSSLLIQREVTHRKQAESEVRQLNSELELRVQQRTEKLEQAQQHILQHANEVKAAHVEMLNRLALAGEYRDDDTGQHTRRVGDMTALLAQRQGFAPDEVRQIQQAARLHDVGKIGVSDTILLKPGKLTEEEFATMKTHTTIGAALFEDGRSELVQIAQRIAASHHEKWDGTGYPQGLCGENIPVEARMLAIADVFDALTHERPYKKAWPVTEAVAEIERPSGRHFDPQLVQTFLQLPHNTLI